MRRVVNLLPLVAVLLVSPFGQAQTKPGNPIANDLAVQAALRQGRQLLARGQVKPAIDVLEAKIAIINGNTDYLATLREAYAAYVRELQLTQRDGQIPEVMAKLKALDPAFETETKTDAPALATPGGFGVRRQEPRRGGWVLSPCICDKSREPRRQQREIRLLPDRPGQGAVEEQSHGRRNPGGAGKGCVAGDLPGGGQTGIGPVRE